MTLTAYCDALARGLQASARPLAARWLERLRALVTVSADEVFPSPALLDHIPAILERMAEYLRAPEVEEIGANSILLEKARELGLLRFEQQASVHQLLREYQILGEILQEFVAEETETGGLSPRPTDCIFVISRMNRAVQVLMQTTVDTFIAEYTDTIHRQTRQLESFNRMVSHELRNPLGTVSYALRLLGTLEPDLDPRRTRVIEMLGRNVERMRNLVDDLERLTRLEQSSDTPSVQEVDLGKVASDVARQLELMAEARGVEVIVRPDLPTAELDPARLELILLNLVSNALKYSDPAKTRRWVEVVAHPRADDDGIALAVRDNGLGIPEQALPSLFARFFRAHVDRDDDLGNEGSGLGLAIVQECAAAVGGSVTVESIEGEGSTFIVSLPVPSRAGAAGPGPEQAT